MLSLQHFIESNIGILKETIGREEMELLTSNSNEAEYLHRSEELGKNPYIDRVKLIEYIISCQSNYHSMQRVELQTQKKKLVFLKESKKKKPSPDMIAKQESICKETEAKMMQSFINIARLRLMYKKLKESIVIEDLYYYED